MGNQESSSVPCGCGKLVELGGCYNETLLGTVKTYHRHLLVCDGNDSWTVPKITADPSAFAAKLCATIKRYKTELKADNKSILAACSEPSLRAKDGATDVIVYPEALRYSLTEAQLDDFVKGQVVEGRVVQDLKPAPLQFKRMVLVCTHGARDKRCGRIGPQVKSKLQELLAAKGLTEQDVVVRGSSHLGGHKYAGVMVVYPEGDWYGYVTSRDADKLIHKYMTDDVVFKEKWRGRMGLTKDQTRSIPVVCTGTEIEDSPHVACSDCPEKQKSAGGGVRPHLCQKACGRPPAAKPPQEQEEDGDAAATAAEGV
eukprot:CAMPEP_0177681822 /NCGR_PEP_ID=MMETSP0447-20121125/30928_1 /TAXON_ID=0 /ORGANISM="Stygamoeba regulata, Strain BSH-02190019" /LENGTH=312 /DNA_ID=CAMNT_0019191279 /DNA_START=161 /DNA_END=1096 /DNA_ORIENTATION=-